MIGDEKLVLAKRKKHEGYYMLKLFNAIFLIFSFAIFGIIFKNNVLLGVSLFFVAYTVLLINKILKNNKLSDDLVYMIRDNIIFYDKDNIKRAIKREDILKIEVDIIESEGGGEGGEGISSKEGKNAFASGETYYCYHNKDNSSVIMFYSKKMRVYTKKGNYVIENVMDANKVKMQILNYKWTNKK